MAGSHAECVLKEPILYLSLYLKTHRQMYYDLLQGVRTHGAWEAWLAFFLEGVEETARQAAETAKALLELFDNDRKEIEALGRPRDRRSRSINIFRASLFQHRQFENRLVIWSIWEFCPRRRASDVA